MTSEDLFIFQDVVNMFEMLEAKRLCKTTFLHFDQLQI